MKELNKKVFITIFLILSLFIFMGILIYNFKSYQEEYKNVYRSLTFMNEKNDFYNKKYDNDLFDSIITSPDDDLDNMRIMDYEVYTIKLSSKGIDRIICHSGMDTDFDIVSIAKYLMNKNEGLRVGNLYNNGYSYNYISDTIVVLNTKSVNKKLSGILILSIIIFALIEGIVYYFSRELTKRITKPALESFNKQKDFIADVSHELKTPLAVIIASSDELKSDKKNKKYIDNIKYESERMNKLIKSMLDLSKLENGVSIDSYKDENISKIIERACLTFEAIAFEHNLKIETNIEDGVVFKCNKEEIEKLISILLDNAIKHSYKESTVVVNLTSNKSFINLSVINNGDPIKPGDEEKIFERFYRADKSRNREANRYGLGLAIAKNIVINHKGTIKAFSKDGMTTFKINLKK